MRALWSLAIVCLVAATGARPVRPANAQEARSELCASLVRSAPPCARALVPQPAAQVAGRRTPAPSLQLPPVALSAAFALAVPSVQAITRVFPVRDREPTAPVLTCSARGPPVA